MRYKRCDVMVTKLWLYDDEGRTQTCP